MSFQVLLLIGLDSVSNHLTFAFNNTYTFYLYYFFLLVPKEMLIMQTARHYVNFIIKLCNYKIKIVIKKLIVTIVYT